MDDAASVHSSTSSQNDVFAIDESFVPSRVHKSAATTQLSFDGLLRPSLVLHEDLQEGCGGQLWPAGMVLSKYMITHHQDDLAGKIIIELGAGGGLVGLAVARGCCSVTATSPILITDQIPMFSLMQRNIEMNNLASKVVAQVYDWGSPAPADVLRHFHLPAGKTSSPADAERFPDIVLAADCVYFEPAFPLLLHTLTDLIGPRTVCYFCFKKRRRADWRFIKEMQKKLHAAPVVYPEKETDQRAGIYLYEIKRKK